jgi:hypothetical protein
MHIISRYIANAAMETQVLPFIAAWRANLSKSRHMKQPAGIAAVQPTATRLVIIRGYVAGR